MKTEKTQFFTVFFSYITSSLLYSKGFIYDFRLEDEGSGSSGTLLGALRLMMMIRLRHQKLKIQKKVTGGGGGVSSAAPTARAGALREFRNGPLYT